MGKARSALDEGSEPKTFSKFMEYFLNSGEPLDYDHVLEEGLKYTRVLKVSTAQGEGESDGGGDSFGSMEIPSNPDVKFVAETQHSEFQASFGNHDN